MSDSTFAQPPAVPAPPTGAASEGPALSAADFERVRRLIRRHAGIHLSAAKQAMVHGRLSRRLRETAHASFEAYLDELEQAGSAADVQKFVNSLTTNLTAFFREEHHFADLVLDLRARAAGGRPLRIWCSAASTGEEPYSIAMTALETLGAAAARVQLLASDIDTRVLETARSGIYPADARGLSPERQRRHFQRGTGPNAGRLRVRPEVARLVKFLPLNLIGSSWAALGSEPFDIVFCRNVMIYFDATTQRQVLKGIHGVMREGAVLYVGHSENFSDARELFRLRGKTVYERV